MSLVWDGNLQETPFEKVPQNRKEPDMNIQKEYSRQKKQSTERPWGGRESGGCAGAQGSKEFRFSADAREGSEKEIM